MKVVRRLSESDCEQVLRLNAASRPGVATLDEPEFRRLLALPNFHLAAQGLDGTLLGYLLAFPGSADYDGEEFLYFRTSSRSPFIYIDQVAVAPEGRRKRVASTLYEALDARANAVSVPMLSCEVNLQPPNPVSLAFHQRSGFNQLAVLATADGRTVALMKKCLNGAEPTARGT